VRVAAERLAAARRPEQLGYRGDLAARSNALRGCPGSVQPRGWVVQERAREQEPPSLQRWALP
jgi:hypothetical protein